MIMVSLCTQNHTMTYGGSFCILNTWAAEKLIDM